MQRTILLSQEHMRFWRTNGFLVLRKALSAKDVDAVLRVVDQQWELGAGNDHEIDVTTGPDQGKSFRLKHASAAHRTEVYKLNNLFLRVPDIRRAAYHPVVRAALIDLLEGEPVICNSLNLERGSQQPFHFDTWYMPPPVDSRMVAASIALEKVDAENGPLIYFPGSHRIPPWRFTDGGLHYRHEEAPAMYAYLQGEIARRGLRPEAFSGEAGDVFIWHAYLYHGGAEILDKRRTRNSLIVHYWRAEDMPAEKVRRDVYGAYLAHTLRGELAEHGSSLL